MQKWLAKYSVTLTTGSRRLDVSLNRRTADGGTRTKRTPPFPLPPGSSDRLTGTDSNVTAPGQRSGQNAGAAQGPIRAPAAGPAPRATDRHHPDPTAGCLRGAAEGGVPAGDTAGDHSTVTCAPRRRAVEAATRRSDEHSEVEPASPEVPDPVTMTQPPPARTSAHGNHWAYCRRPKRRQRARWPSAPKDRTGRPARRCGRGLRFRSRRRHDGIEVPDAVTRPSREGRVRDRRTGGGDGIPEHA